MVETLGAPRYWTKTLTRFASPLVVGFCLLAACSETPKVTQPAGPVVLSVGGSGGADDAEGPGLGGATQGGPDLPHPEPTGAPCNGAALLCDSPYDATSFAITHASMANSPSFWDFPAQHNGIRQQLDDSIRGLMLEVHEYAGKPTLCAYDCAEGRSALTTELGHVRGFLDDNPREVVTLFVDNRVPASDVLTAFDAADLSRYLYVEEPRRGWPTLGALIDAGTRLVVFVTEDADAPPGFRSLRDNVSTTGDSFTSARDFPCDLATDAGRGAFLLINQFLVTSDGEGGAGGASGGPPGRPSEALAETVNHDPFLSERLGSCADYLGRKPSFVALDFYDASDVIGAVQRLNGVIH